MSSLMSSMLLDELRSFYHIPDNVSLELSDGPACSTVGQADNAVFFTREQFAVGLHFPVSLLVKQFLHVTRAPPAIIHLNVFWILIGCSILNFLYSLDISLTEICFVYTLKLGTRGRLSMSAHSPRLQFVTGLPDSLRTKAKEIVLVKGLWYETPSFLGLSFDVNQSLTFPSWSEFGCRSCPMRRFMF